MAEYTETLRVRIAALKSENNNAPHWSERLAKLLREKGEVKKSKCSANWSGF